MIVFLKSDGSVAYRSYENINLGSNKANKLTVIAPFDPSSVMTVCITLPNGETLEPIFMANRGKATKELEGYSIDGKNLSVWEKEIESYITGISGTLRIQLYINNDGADFTSPLITIEVNVGVKNIPTPPPTEGAIYEDIIDYLSDSMNYVEGGKQEAESAATEAKTSKTEAVAAANAASESETSASESKEEAEKAAVSAAKSATNARTSASAAENYLTELKSGIVEPLKKRVDNIDYILAQFGAVISTEDKEVAFSKLIPKDSDLYAYINSFSGVTYRNLIDIENVPASVDGLTITKTDTGFLLNCSGDVDTYGAFPIKYWQQCSGKFYLTVREPLPENVSIDVWTGPPSYDYIVCTLDSNSLVKSFGASGYVSFEVKITGALKDYEIAPCLSYGKPMYYGEEATDLSSIEKITDYVEVWNGKDYELGSIDSSGLNKEQAPDVRSGFIPIPDDMGDGTTNDIIRIEKNNDSSTEIMVFYYDENKAYLNNAEVTDNNGIAIISGAKYIRIRLERSTGMRLFAKTVKLYNPINNSLIWDGTVELGSLSTSSSTLGDEKTTTCGIRTDYISVVLGRFNYALNDYSGTISIYAYNSSKTFISKQSVSKTANELTLPSGTEYVKLLLSKAYDYNGEVIFYKGKTEEYSLDELKDLLYDYAYGSGLDAVTCNKVDFENGYYEQWCDSNGNILTDENGDPITEPEITPIPNSVMVDIFGGLDPLVKITKNKAITFENDNDTPVPSVITYNIIQEA